MQLKIWFPPKLSLVYRKDPAGSKLYFLSEWTEVRQYSPEKLCAKTVLCSWGVTGWQSWQSVLSWGFSHDVGHVGAEARTGGENIENGTEGRGGSMSEEGGVLRGGGDWRETELRKGSERGRDRREECREWVKGRKEEEISREGRNGLRKGMMKDWRKERVVWSYERQEERECRDVEEGTWR